MGTPFNTYTKNRLKALRGAAGLLLEDIGVGPCKQTQNVVLLVHRRCDRSKRPTCFCVCDLEKPVS
jgi:hypothetical protein